MLKICPPALIYLVFSLVQIIIDIFRGFYNVAFVKTIIMTMVTFLLNALCEQGLDIVAWIIIFIPFFTMSVVTAMVLYVFGLQATNGKFDYSKINATYTVSPTSKKTNSPPFGSSSNQYDSGP